jgi:hypothetical protein
MTADFFRGYMTLKAAVAAFLQTPPSQLHTQDSGGQVEETKINFVTFDSDGTLIKMVCQVNNPGP